MFRPHLKMLASSLQTVVQTGDNTQSPGIPGMVLFNFASREKFIVTILRNMMPLFASYLTGDRSGTITPSNFKNQNEIVTFCSRSACEHVAVNIFEPLLPAIGSPARSISHTYVSG